MNSAFELVFTFVIMLGLGFALARAGLLDAATSQKVTSIVLWIFVPASMLYNVYTYLDADALLRDGVDVLVPFVTTLAAYALARLLCMALRVPAHKRGVVCAMFALSNTIFVGLPVNQALFGDVATP